MPDLGLKQLRLAPRKKTALPGSPSFGGARAARGSHKHCMGVISRQEGDNANNKNNK